MSYTIEEQEVGRFTVTVGYDESGADSPRDWDNGTTLCLTHRRYDLPNEGNIPFESLDTFEEVLAYVAETFDVVGEVLTVSMTDHSSVHYYTGSPRDPWDSGIVGVIFMTREGQKLVGTPDDRIADCLQGDVETFSQWANGEVYYWEVTPATGDSMDACHGYYSVEEAMAEGVSHAEYWEDKILTEVGRQIDAFASLG